MSARPVAYFGITICAVAAIGELILAITATSHALPGDAMGFVAPYAILGFFLWRRRNDIRVSCILAGIVSLLAAWALYLTGVDAYRFHTEPDYRLLQRWSPFLVLVVQWVVALLISAGLFISWILSRQRKDSGVTGVPRTKK